MRRMPTIDEEVCAQTRVRMDGDLSLADVRTLACKRADSWWTVLLVDPVAVRLVRWTARRTRITPDQVTWAALVVGLGAAGCFLRGGPGWLAAGALLYHLSFVLDCVDGKLARLQGSATLFGRWFEFALDRARVACSAVALMLGQSLHHGHTGVLALAVGVIFLDMFHSLNVLKTDQIRAAMRSELTQRPACRSTGSPVVVEQLPCGEGASGGEDGGTVDLHQGFRRRFPRYTRLRDRMLARRIHLRPVSGIEFRTAVFVVGPATGQVVAVTLLAGAALVIAEVAAICELLFSFRDFGLARARLAAAPRLLPEARGAATRQA